MNYSAITKSDIANGPGIRTVLWVSGCNHHCPGCQNPQTWDPQSGQPFDTAAFINLMAELQDDYVRGLTVSGGDPLLPVNVGQVQDIISSVRAIMPEKDVWMWTGYEWDEVKYLPIMRLVDVLVDGPYIEAQRDITLAWRGSSNQRVIDVQKSLAENKVVLYEE